MVDERYQTVKEVADLLKLGDATVRRWIRDGELRAIDIGKGWRIAASDLDAFLRRHATRPAEAPDEPASMRDESGDAQGSSVNRKAKGSPC